MEEEEINKQLEEAAYLLKAVANETRLAIIMQLSDGKERSVTELMEEMECEQSLLSHHLTDMRAKGILNCRKSGKNCFYSIRNKQVLQLLHCMMQQDNQN
jgi:ArsR family transcriptional regulator